MLQDSLWHSAVSVGNTPGYEPVCHINGPHCQKRATGICWDCMKLVCFTCGESHYYEANEMRGGYYRRKEE